MDIEKILSALSEKLGKTSLSDRTIKSFIEVELPKEEKDLTNEWYSTQVKKLKTIEGQYNHDIAEKIKELEKNSKNTEGEQNSNTPNQEETNDTMDESVKKLYEELVSIKTQLKEQETRTKKESFRERIEKGLKEKGATDSYVLKNVLRDLEFDETQEFDKSLENAISIYNREYKECRGDSNQPRGGNGGQNDTDQDAMIQTFIERHFGKEDK